MRGNRPITDLLDAPNGKRISQLLFGEPFAVEQTDGAFSFGTAECGYQGWVASAALERSRTSTARVRSLATYVYAAADMKSETRLRLPFMAQVKTTGITGEFTHTPEGFIFSRHLQAQPPEDFVKSAAFLINTPYLWGGRSSAGIDCSGLVQLSLASVGLPAPRDSGPQSRSLGTALPADAPLVRGDLVFWQGHVGIMQNSDSLLHATAFSMTVMAEPLATAVQRIKAQGNGDITALRRLV